IQDLFLFVFTQDILHYQFFVHFKQKQNKTLTKTKIRYMMILQTKTNNIFQLHTIVLKVK
ncbi:hypothetical protein, partial [Streptococcus agalactiae]|uniref:hypothetical protein n=1 Tax=Streptococcus agalactiae TaxID=1311 RepID=UPI001C4039D4